MRQLVERTHQQYMDLYRITTHMYRARREMGDCFISLSQELGSLVQLERRYDKSGYLTELTSKLGTTYAEIQKTVQVQQAVDCFDLAETVDRHSAPCSRLQHAVAAPPACCAPSQITTKHDYSL